MPKEQGSEAKEFTEFAEHKGLYESNFTRLVKTVLPVKLRNIHVVRT